MTFDEVLDQVRELLRTRGRVSYQSLKVRFTIADQFLEGVKAELIEAERVAVDEDGKVLVWVGQSSPESRVQSLESKTSPSPDARRQTLDPRPIDYTPAHLAERIRAVSLTEGERKTITALFADLKGSTALIEGLDPEEARAIIDPALQLMMDAMHRYEGYVAQALGDGIFALFGAPIAHEDHPQRALYAALRAFPVQSVVVCHDHDQDVLRSVTEVRCHLLAGRHGLRRQRLHGLALDDFGQGGECDRQHHDQGHPRGDDEPGSAHHGSTQRREAVETSPGGDPLQHVDTYFAKMSSS